MKKDLIKIIVAIVLTWIYVVWFMKGKNIRLGFYSGLLALLLATCFGSSGLLGSIGELIAALHFHYLGYIAYVDVFYLLYVSFLIRQKSLRALQSLLASLLGFLALLMIQSLLLHRGEVGMALLEAMLDYIGTLGAWVVALIILVYAYSNLFPKSFTSTLKHLRAIYRSIPAKLKTIITSINNALNMVFKIKPTPKTPLHKDFFERESLPFKVKVSHYTETPKEDTLQVRLIDLQNTPPDQTLSNPPCLDISAHLDLLQQRHSLENPPIQKLANSKPSLLPPTDLLNPIPIMPQPQMQIQEKSQNLLAKLRMFKIEGQIVNTHVGPLVTTFEFRPAGHVKVSRVLSLTDDLAMALCAQSIRIQAPIKGKDTMGIEIANAKSAPISLREILESPAFEQAPALSLALGKNTLGEPYVLDLKTLPHLLIAGSTGSGKSVGMHAMIISLLYKNTPRELQFLIIDPKRVEFSMYANIPHLKAPIITDPQQAISVLNEMVQEMEARYMLLSEQRVKNIDAYNKKINKEQQLPFIVFIIDELADLMLVGGKEVETPIIRIAQMGRASGLHLIIATQRPSVDILTGLIKTNLPCKISFKVGSKIDSRVILDTEGAQNLLGKGDMLLIQPGSSAPIRLHGPYVAEEEIERIIDFIESQSN
ncbi:DNA translocase FtsK [Helicobacter suis]|uniref:DNA translocase FtsK n=1 Tax=Helicobacter suis TaxID=104628 RepID=UPI0001F7A234|nr:Cell division protein [Helicobacter suis HS1]